MKRITLRAVYKTAEGDFQPGASIEVEDLKADQLVKAGKAVVAELQTIYTHEEDMPAPVREKALKAQQAADAAGGINDVAARAAATAPFRK
jgi:hypothetical protein